jgi:hypothetical protein
MEGLYDTDSILYNNIFVDPADLEDLTEDEKQVFIQKYKERLAEETKQKQIDEFKEAEKRRKERMEKEALEKPKRVQIPKKSVEIIDSTFRNIKKYSKQNTFKYDFTKSFSNIHSIRLISSVFPNTDSVIKNLPAELRNNRIYWENEEDYGLGEFNISFVTANVEANKADITVSVNYIEVGDKVTIVNTNSIPVIEGIYTVSANAGNIITVDTGFNITGNGTTGQVKLARRPIYSVQLRPGSYNINSIVEELATKLNFTKRQFGYGDFHEFSISLDPDTDTVSFTLLENALLQINPLSVTAGSTIITVSHLAHGYSNGQLITFSGAKSIGSISTSVLNDSYNIVVIDANSYSYEVNERAIETVVSGGGNVMSAGSLLNFRFLWGDYSGTIANNLGFNIENSGETINITDPLSNYSYTINNISYTDTETTFTIPAHNLSVGIKVKVNGLTSNPDLYSNFSTITSTTTNTITINKGLVFLDPNYGDIEILTNLMKLNYPSHGFNEIIDINETGPNFIEIETKLVHNFILGDYVYISNTDTVPPINGYYQTTSIINPTKFSITFANPATITGTTGSIGIDNNFHLYNVHPSDDIYIGGVDVEEEINNKNQTVYKVVDEDNFLFTVSTVATSSSSGGQENIRISSYRHGFRGQQTNLNTETTLVRPIKLEDVDYVFICSPEIGGTLGNNANVQNAFAAILLSEPTGNVIFNSFLQNERIYTESPLPFMDSITLEVKRPDGYPYEFNNIDYVISLEIVEYIDIFENAYVSSQRGVN